MFKADYLSSQEITNLVIKYQRARKLEKKQHYKDAVFENVIRYISKLANQHASRNRHIDVEDFFQAGVVGFCEALRGFSAKKKTMFSTYLTLWVKKHMYDVSYENNLIYTPKNVIQDAYKQQRYERDGKKFSYNDRSKSFLNSQHLVFLDKDEHGENLHDLIKSPVQIDTEIEGNSQHSHVMKIIDKYLTPKEQKIIKLRYFNMSGEVYKLQQIGKMVNLSTERVRQIESKAIHKLRSKSKMFDTIQV